MWRNTMLQLHRVQIDTLRFTKNVTVLAASQEAACQAAAAQVGAIIGTTYLGLADGVVLGDEAWQLAETFEFSTNYGGS